MPTVKEIYKHKNVVLIIVLVVVLLFFFYKSRNTKQKTIVNPNTKKVRGDRNENQYYINSEIKNFISTLDKNRDEKLDYKEFFEDALTIQNKESPIKQVFDQVKQIFQIDYKTDTKSQKEWVKIGQVTSRN